MSIGTFYRHRRVLVTGHTGFKGAWLATWLKALGANVTGFAMPPEGPSLFDSAGVARGMKSLLGDIRDERAVRDVFHDERPEVVLHLAAQPLVRRSYREPVETFQTNVLGTVNVLEAARRTPSVRGVVVVTSDKCYENREWAWGYREHEAMGGHDPYSASKGCAELVTAAYRRSFFHEAGTAGIASGRAGNVIGGGDWAEDRLVPDIIRALMAGQPVVIRRPGAIRPWQHVLEPLRGYLMLGERVCEDPHQFGDGWNFGPLDEDAIPVGELAGELVRLWGSGDLRIETPPDDLHEAGYLKLDSSRARSRLGWKPVLRLEETLRLTCDWYREFAQRPESAAELMESQIASVMRRHVALESAPGRVEFRRAA